MDMDDRRVLAWECASFYGVRMSCEDVYERENLTASSRVYLNWRIEYMHT
jgi:hypothetical protein